MKKWLKKIFWQKIHPSWVILAGTVGIVAGMIGVIATRSCLLENLIWLICGVVLIASVLIRPTYAFLVLPFTGGMMIAQYRAGIDLVGQEYLAHFVGETVTLAGTVAEDPDLSEEKTALRLKELCLGECAQVEENAGGTDASVELTSGEAASVRTNAQEVAGTIYVQLSRTDEIERSDRVILTGELSDGFGTFAATMFRPSVEKVEREEPGDVLLHIRNSFAAGVKLYVPEPEVDLGLGYLLGVRNSLPEDINAALQVVGLTHIVVASGANLAILVDLARKWLGKVSRWCALVGATLLVLVFVGMVGLTASMTRAAMVTLLSLTTWYVGRKFQPTRLLLIVAAITLLYNPMYLLDLGWLLSFAAFTGIMIVGPKLTRFLYGERQPNFIMATAIETLAANLLCLPLLLYTFGQVSLISLLANLLIVPTIPIVMMLTLLVGLTASWPGVATLLGKVTTMILAFHLYIVDWLGEQTIFLMEISINDWRVFLLYIPIVVILSISGIRKQIELRKKRREIEEAVARTAPKRLMGKRSAML